MFIYTIENKLNNKIYIGQTIQKNPYRRWYSHLSEGKLNKRSQVIVDRAIRKYGKENFSFTVIAQHSTQDELNLSEVSWIKHFREVLGVKNVYNIKDGGNGGGPPTLETRLKISQSNTGRKSPFKGKCHTEESKKKQSLARKGKFTGGENPLFGKPRSEEDKEKISKAQRKLSDDEIFNVIQDYATGNYSHRDLAKKYGVSKWPIGRILSKVNAHDH